MSLCREILTLQLGSTANYVGSHLWSIQEMGFNYNTQDKSEICHDVLFREGLNIRGEVTFTPRVVCLERASKLTNIPVLEDPQGQGPVLWDNNKVEKIDIPEEQLHPFIQDLNDGVDTSVKEYAFESSIRGWGDMLRTRLHPRSVLTKYTPSDEELEDRIRLYVEECDNIQGFNIIIDATESFPEVLSFLDDEFSSKPRITMPIVTNVGELPRKDAATRLVKIFSLYHDAATLSSLTVPLSCVKELSLKQEPSQNFPDLEYSPSLYHTSAIIATFLDCFSLTYRTNSNTDLSDVISGLTTRGWKFSNASLALPFPIPPNTHLENFLESRDDQVPLYSSLTPDSSPDNSWYQTFGFRGILDNGTLLRYLQYLSSSVSSVQSITAPMPTLAPFPKIFSPHVSTKGSVDLSASRMPGFHVKTVSTLAGLHACPGLGKMLKNFSETVSKLKIKRLSEITEEYDNFEEKIENMNNFSECHSLQVDFI